MAAYLYPELPSKKAYKDAIKDGKTITARDNTPYGEPAIQNGTIHFEGPHYPKPHVYYGKAVVKDGKVVSIS